jgi:hypothetical protein
VLHNNYVPVASYALDVRLFRSDGELALELPGAVVLQPRETLSIELESLLEKAGLRSGFRGSAQIALSLTADAAVLPSVFQLVTEISSGGRLAACDVGSDIFDGGRTRVFSRILVSDDYETTLVVVYPRSATGDAPVSQTTVSLISADGSERLKTVVAIRPQGALFASIEELFPHARAFLERSSGVGTVRVRDTTARLFGFHIVRQRRTNSIALDHLIGG